MKAKPPKKNKKNVFSQKKLSFSIWYVMLAFFVMYLIQSFIPQKDVKNIPYSEFKSLVQNDRIVRCILYPAKIVGVMIKADSLISTRPRQNPPPSRDLGNNELEENQGLFSAIRVEDPGLANELQERGIRYEGRNENGSLRSILLYWIVPLVILVAIWGFAFRRMNPQGGMMSIGKSKAKIYVEGKIKTTFKDVAGLDEAVEEISEVVEFLKNPEKFQKLGGKIPKGVLLVGPPGTGKTLLAKAVAGEAKTPFFSLSGSDFVEMFVGVGAARVRDLFQSAAKVAPSIVFIDELDALGKARGMNPMAGHDEREQTLNQLLVEMDGFDANTGVILVAATNRPEILDMALLRPGRFDRKIVVDRPDINGREAILKVHSETVKLRKNIDLRVIAARTPGFVGADLANIINEAALLAARRDRKAVSLDDLEESIDRVVAGLERKSRVLNKKEKDIVAYHEAGHAIVAGSLSDVDPVHRVSIIPRGVTALGYTLQLPTEDRYLMTKTELLNRLQVFLGGRVAEQIIFDEISTGAQNDLERGTAIAHSMVTEYGMSEKLGPLSYAKEKHPMFLSGDFGSGSAYSEKIAAEIDTEVREIVENAHKKVQVLLLAKKDKLEALAKMLLDKEVVEGETLDQLLNDENTNGKPVKKTKELSA